MNNLSNPKFDGTLEEACAQIDASFRATRIDLVTDPRGRRHVVQTERTTGEGRYAYVHYEGYEVEGIGPWNKGERQTLFPVHYSALGVVVGQEVNVGSTPAHWRVLRKVSGYPGDWTFSDLDTPPTYPPGQRLLSDLIPIDKAVRVYQEGSYTGGPTLDRFEWDRLPRLYGIISTIEEPRLPDRPEARVHVSVHGTRGRCLVTALFRPEDIPDLMTPVAGKGFVIFGGHGWDGLSDPGV